jgi:hypothetical protein
MVGDQIEFVIQRGNRAPVVIEVGVAERER